MPLVKQITKYVFKMLKCFGVYEEDDMPVVGEGQSLNYEEVITPLMNALSKYRD